MTAHSTNMPWYKGPSVVDALDRFTPQAALHDQPLRLPVQDVYKFDERRIIVGRIESGAVKVGDSITFSPSNTPATVASIEAFGVAEQPTEAYAGQSVGITLTDQIFVERGHVAHHADHMPKLSNQFKARLFWLGRAPLERGKRYKLKIGTSELMGEVSAIEQVVNTDTLAHEQAEVVERNAVAEVAFRVRGLASLDDFADHARTGRFVVIDNYDVAGGGIISTEDIADQRVAHGAVKSQNITTIEQRVTPESRAAYNGHTGGVLWLTGLPASGKSTLAMELEQRLFNKGYQVYVLDGENIRAGLSSDLGFSPKDRAEHNRRVGEMAANFAQAGFIVIAAVISPYAEDRRRARSVAPDTFNLVHVQAPVEVCEQRDTKGLYVKARAGEVTDFTGISAPYEAPENPDLTLDTASLSIDESVNLLEEYVDRNFVAPVNTGVRWDFNI